MKKRTSEPFMPAPAFAHTLAGMGINLVVADVATSVAFQRDVLGVAVVYEDPDFAVLAHDGATWMVHADHTYDHNPLRGVIAGAGTRGAGVELRLYGVDPDAAEARARALGHHVLAGSLDKPHGLRESVIVDPDGYVWIPSARSEA